MFIELTNGATKKEIEVVENIFFKKKASSGFNAKKYNGVLKIKEDPLTIQLKLRDKWGRESFHKALK